MVSWIIFILMFCVKRCKKGAYTRWQHTTGSLTSGWIYTPMGSIIIFTLRFYVKRCKKVAYKRWHYTAGSLTSGLIHTPKGSRIIFTLTFYVKICKKVVYTRWHHTVGSLTSGWWYKKIWPLISRGSWEHFPITAAWFGCSSRPFHLAQKFCHHKTI